MKSRARTLILLVTLFVAAAGVGKVWRSSPPHTNTPLERDAYVWQRAWDGPVQAAVQEHGSNFGRLVVLAGEVAWENRKPRLTRVALDYPALRTAGAPVGLCLRIGPFAGPFATNDIVAQWLAAAADAILSAARSNQLDLAELQLDFDCATSRLDGYRSWLSAIRTAVGRVPLTITTLPAWLNRPGFKALLDATDGYVLQVHSLERPRDATQAFALCDPRQAVRWAEQAARFGAPFRVALPTYGYRLIFDASGQFVGLNAEGPEKIFSNASLQREVRADPGEMAAVVRQWGRSHPTALTGVIWYRLPVSGDSLNWSWTTLSEVIAGRDPQPGLCVRLRQPQPGLTEVALANEGRADFSGRPSVRARWNNRRLVAADGLAGFAAGESSVDSIEFTIGQHVRLAPGEERWIGWARLDAEGEVIVELLQK